MPTGTQDSNKGPPQLSVPGQLLDGAPAVVKPLISLSFEVTFCGGGMAEWFRALDLNSGGPRFKSFTLSLSGFVLGSLAFNTSTALCK